MHAVVHIHADSDAKSIHTNTTWGWKTVRISYSFYETVNDLKLPIKC